MPNMIIPTNVEEKKNLISQRKQSPPSSSTIKSKEKSSSTSPLQSMWYDHSILRPKKKQQSNLQEQFATKHRVQKSESTATSEGASFEQNEGTADLFSKLSPQWKPKRILFKEEKIREFSLKGLDLFTKMSPRWRGVDTLVVFKPGVMGLQFKGNRITSVAPGSQAEIAGVCVGWQITAVNGERQSNDGDQINIVIDKTYERGKPTHILFCTNNIYPDNKRMSTFSLGKKPQKTSPDGTERSLKPRFSPHATRRSPPPFSARSIDHINMSRRRSPSTSPETHFKRSPRFQNRFRVRSPSTSPDSRIFRKSPTNAYSILIGNSHGNCVPPSRNQALIDGAIRSIKDLNSPNAISTSTNTTATSRASVINGYQSPEDTDIREDMFSRLSPRWRGRNPQNAITDKIISSQQSEEQKVKCNTAINKKKDVTANIPNTTLVTFQPGPMGIRVEGNRVVGVRPGSQAEQAHIVIGWRVIAVNGRLQPNNTKIIDKAIDETYKANKPTVILFLKPNPNHAKKCP